MKRAITISLFLVLNAYLYGQTAITINASDIPVPTAAFNITDVTGLIPNPVPTANFSWDYGTINSATTLTANYITETDPNYTALGIDVYQSGFKSLTTGLATNLGYNIFYEYDFNATAVDDKAIYIDAQSYSLGALTGNTKDSLTFPAQGWLWNSPRRIMQFPFTDKSSWFSTSVRETDFNLTVSLAGLNKAPGKHYYAILREDTIVGWGKMRVYTPSGPSNYYDVLVDRISQVAIDSFYLNGAPANQVLLSAFGITQGQFSDYNNRYNVYRKGSFQYLFSSYYGSNDHSTTPTGEFYNSDNLLTSTGDLKDKEYSVLLYPNPCTSDNINILTNGLTIKLDNYQIIDMIGRTISKGSLDSNGNNINIQLPANCLNGNYIIYLNDEKGNMIATESFILQR
ncbi:MAG TPA: T9SS type A sorting domain-containing protein [Saprospiraceae bacterium]|nr:T9SS type A sorting domain-containing protein [Saprospiraceae bacterium]